MTSFDKRLQIAVLSTAALILSACACEPVTLYQQVPLEVPRPDEPILGISVEDYRTMSDEVYERVKTRDDALLHLLAKHRAVILSTQSEATRGR